MVTTNVRTASSGRLHTQLCKTLGIEYPIMQAGMGMIARGDLAGAVSEAGGLGVIGAAHLTPDQLRDEIRIVKKRTQKPFGVDILFGMPKNTDDESVSYSQEVGDLAQVVLDERVPVLVSGLGSPKLVIQEAHELGMTVMSIVGNTRQAVNLVNDGVDVVIGQGHEGGGHTGSVGTIVLIPSLVDAVDVPVVAAGGLADGRGLAAALALGATGVWMGTRFIAADEACAHDNYKNKVIDVNESGTIVTRAHSGKPCRMIKNNFTDFWEDHKEEIEPFPLQVLHVGREASLRGRLHGDVDEGVVPAGQSAGLIKATKPAGEIVREIAGEAETTLERLAAL